MNGKIEEAVRETLSFYSCFLSNIKIIHFCISSKAIKDDVDIGINTYERNETSFFFPIILSLTLFLLRLPIPTFFYGEIKSILRFKECNLIET